MGDYKMSKKDKYYSAKLFTFEYIWNEDNIASYITNVVAFDECSDYIVCSYINNGQIKHFMCDKDKLYKYALFRDERLMCGTPITADDLLRDIDLDYDITEITEV